MSSEKHDSHSVYLVEFLDGNRALFHDFVKHMGALSAIDIDSLVTYVEPVFPPEIEHGPDPTNATPPGETINVKPKTVVYNAPPFLRKFLWTLTKVHRVTQDDVIEYTGDKYETYYSGVKTTGDSAGDVYHNCIRVRSAYGDWQGWVDADSVAKSGVRSFTKTELICYVLSTDGPAGREEIESRIAKLTGVKVAEYMAQFQDSGGQSLIAKGLIRRQPSTLYYLTPAGEEVAQQVREKIFSHNITK